MGAQVDDAHRRAQLVGDQVAGRLRDEDLAAMTRRADPGRAMDVQPDIALRRAPRLAGVEAHPVAHRDPVGPGMAGDRELPIDGGLDRGARRREDEVQPVARRARARSAPWRANASRISRWWSASTSG